MSSSSAGRRNEQQQLFHRQATILRKNLYAFDHTLHQRQQEDWPRMLGRLNAAWNQAYHLNSNGIDDVLEHFVYQPKKCPANPQDVPFFLSTRLADAPVPVTSEEEEEEGKVEKKETNDSNNSNNNNKNKKNVDGDNKDGDKHSTSKRKANSAGLIEEDPTKLLRIYEEKASQMASEYEHAMVRF